jgi:hypothetical protein
LGDFLSLVVAMVVRSGQKRQSNGLRQEANGKAINIISLPVRLAQFR